MIVAATKYGSVRAQSMRGRLVRNNIGRNVDPTTARRAAVRTSGAPAPRVAPKVFVPKLGKDVPFAEWFWRELREGGYLHRYLQTELHTTRARMRATARRMDGFKQNNKSEFRLLAAIPAREFFRWRKYDPHFWDDNNNLRSWKRDNPDACVYL